MTRRIVLATRNPGKVKDVQHLLGGLDVEIVPVTELPDVADVEETGATFVENATLKAVAVSRAAGLAALADDSGLEVDALGGAPGVISARWSGATGSREEVDAANNRKLLAALAGVPPERRTARFRSVVCFADAAGPLGREVLLGQGACEGVVLDALRGTGGFGYDPLFFAPELGKTFAEATIAEKGAVSHRARALADLLPRLRGYFHVANRGA